MKMQMLIYFFLGIVVVPFLQRYNRLMPIRHRALFSVFAGFLFCFAAICLPWGIRLILTWIFLLGLLLVSYVDIRQKIILDEILLLLLLIGIVFNGVGGSRWQEMLLGALIGNVLLGLIYVISKGGIGLGDVKFAGVLGIWTGIPGVLVNLCMAFLIGGMVALLLCVLHKATPKSRIPFAPCLSVGAVLSLFFSSRILDWYWSLFL